MGNKGLKNLKILYIPWMSYSENEIN